MKTTLIAALLSALLLSTGYAAPPGGWKVYNQQNQYQGRYSPGIGGSYNYYDSRNIYQGRYSPNLNGGYNKFDSRNTYRGYVNPTFKGAK